MIRVLERLPIRFEYSLFANFAGAGWAAFMQLLFIPQYIRLMGMEAFGMIGFYLTLQGVLQILDLGLSPTMNREMARYSVEPGRANDARDFARTVEVCYWALGLLIGICIVLAAHPAATLWVNSQALSITVVEQAIVLMGVLTILQWPLTLYSGGLMGLQRQVELNVLQILTSTANNVGAFLILLLVSPTLQAFLLWQIGVNLLRVTLMAVLFWMRLPASDHAPRVHIRLVHPVLQFAAGMTGITVSAIILTQLDKVILSKLLSLEAFGFYTLAVVVSNGLSLIITSIFNAIFPRLSAMAAVGDQSAERDFYHRGAQLMSVVIAPIAALIIFFSYDILVLWTGNVDIAKSASPSVDLLVVGTALNGLMNLPYALQLAHGWTSLGLRLNTLFITLQIPCLVLLSLNFGVVGAASVWLIVNSVYMLLGVPLTHRRLLSGQAREWFVRDTLAPCLTALLVVGAGRMLMQTYEPTFVTLVGMVLVLLAGFVAAGLIAGRLRRLAFTRVADMRLRLMG